MPIKKFDWSTLTRLEIYDNLQLLQKSIVNKRLTADAHYKILANHIRKIAPIRVVKKVNYNVGRNSVIIGGQYNSEWDEENKKAITIFLYYCPFDRHIRMPIENFVFTCKNISDTILHEIIHMRQYRRRNFEYTTDYKSKEEQDHKRKEQSYLGCKDEIDAFGFNIACELYDRFGNRQKSIEKYLECKHPKKHCLYKYYLDTFNKDHSHPVIQQLKKKIKKYLPLAEIGKPYKNNYWLWY